MAELADRLYKRKRIKDPNDPTNYVDVPVIYRAKIVTAADQYQEQWIYFDNSSGSSRKVRIQKVYNHDQSSSIDCERVNSFFTKTAADQYQEHEWVLDNKDPPPIQQDGSDSPAHEKKHIVRYFRDNDAGTIFAVDCELIDELKIILAAEQYQEYRVITLNPDLGDPIDDSSVPYTVTKGFCDPSLDLAPLDTGLDPPYRLDPFQNIVNLIDNPWLFFGVQFSSGDSGSILVSGGNTHQALGSKVTSQEYLTGFFTTRLPNAGSGTFTAGSKTYNYSGLGSFSGPSGSFTAFTVCGWNGVNPAPFNAERIRSLVTASGSPYLQYPTATNPEPGWLTTTSATLATLAFNGTGPFDIYVSDPINGPFVPGLLSNATAAQISADYTATPPGTPNLSIYEFGDSQGTAAQNFSGLTVTGPVGSPSPATWLPVAVSVGQIGPLRDGFILHNANPSSVTILLKRQ